jgi:hypothetical protein
MLERREVERVSKAERLPKKVVKKAVSIEKEAREGLRALGPEAVRGRIGGPERERREVECGGGCESAQSRGVGGAGSCLRCCNMPSESHSKLHPRPPQVLCAKDNCLQCQITSSVLLLSTNYAANRLSISLK